jgi:hypothetical protein
MKKLETIKTPLLSGHGTYVYGQLDELDFTIAGSGFDDNKKPISWGHSVKLKFINSVKAVKMLNGIQMIQNKTVIEYLSIQCDSEDDIANKLAFFEEYRFKEILVPINNTSEKITYKINENDLKIIDSKTQIG